MVLESLSESLRSFGDVLSFIWILAATFIIGKTAFFALRRYVLNVREGDGSLNERIANESRVPFYFLIWSVGLYYAFKALNFLEPYYPYLDRMFILLLVIPFMYLLRKTINTSIIWYAAKDKRRIRIEQTSLMGLKNIVNIFIFTIAAIIILGQFNVDVTPLMASLGIGGLAVALALQPTLSNYFAGVYITSDKTVRLGDYIEVEGDVARGGYVDKMGWRTVAIRTIQNNIISVPNSKLADAVIVNYYQPKAPMLTKVEVGVGYGNNLNKVEEVTLRVAKKVLKETDAGIDGEDPYVRFHEFGDSNINFRVWFKIKRWEKQFLLKDEFIKALKTEYDKEGIEIAFPCVNLYHRRSADGM